MTDVNMGEGSLLSFFIHLILFFGILFTFVWIVASLQRPVTKAINFARYALAEVIHTFITNTRNNH